MAEPDKRQIGDGSDNYGEAARQVARAARESGKWQQNRLPQRVPKRRETLQLQPYRLV